ncbi:MAG: hypothetical protein DKINENOH_03862 [bacterium]|nr:hypothetical protein [bacterium]
MASIPLTTFDGYLKQLAIANLPETYRNIFNLLFPRFSDKQEISELQKHSADQMAEIFAGYVEVAVVPEQPRRFAGWALPRGRYFSVCSDSHGNDNNTLVHEMRTYRNPSIFGMVEVIDLGAREKLRLRVGDDTHEIKGDSSIGVLIHNLNRIPREFSQLTVERFRWTTGKTLGMLRFPYEIKKEVIPDVIDLRLPKTRDWFHEYFSKPQENSGIIWPEQLGPLATRAIDPTVALSRFRLVSGRAPRPKVFFDMLPTLMNPDIGGGKPSDTGSTVQAIGYWMRNNKVSAFIYPSARCDVFVEVENGELVNFGGWSLVDYRSIEQDKAIDTHTYDYSPWCWVKFPEGVSVGVADNHSIHSGSFYINGVVNYWAKDYLEQIRSLEVMYTELKGLKSSDSIHHEKSEITYYETWKIGIYIIRWLRLVLLKTEFEEVLKSMRLLKGLALLHNFYYTLGEIEEIFHDLNREGNLEKALRDSILLSGKIANYFQRWDKEEHEQIINTAVDFELLILLLWGIKLRGTIPGRSPITKNLNKDSLYSLPLPKEMKRKVSDYIESLKDLLSGQDENLDKYLLDGEQIEADISNYFASGI